MAKDMGRDIPTDVVIWSFGGKKGNVKSQNSYSTAGSGNGYNLHCRANGQFLTYHKTNVGINLGYTSNAKERKIHLRLPDGKERALLAGEKVALGIGGGDAFLKYAHRTAGINLTWAASPSFEWRVYAPTVDKGQPIPTGSVVAIINEKVEPDADFMVYLDRPVGADVGWTTSTDWKGKITNWPKKKLDDLLS